MSLTRINPETGRIERRTTSVQSRKSYARSYAETSVPEWVKIRKSVATRDDLIQYHEYLSGQMRNLYGIIRADGVELKQDTITTLKWFDDKLQEEHQKMLASIANLKTAAESQHAVTGEQLVHADKVFEEFRTNVINGINAQGNSLQESLEKREQTAKDV